MKNKGGITVKKCIALLLVVVLLPVFSLADLPDISGLSYDELLQLRDQVNLAIMNSPEYQEITLPVGLWTVGVDIPAGTWLITPLDGQYLNLWYGDVLNESGTDAGYGWDWVNGYNKTMSTRKNKDGSWKDPDKPHSVTITMKEGWYLRTGGAVVLTPGTPKN